MKTIPNALLGHKAQHATTLTDLLRVGPLPDGTYRGFTLLDVQGIRMASTAKSPGNLPLLTPATLAAGTGATRAATESLNQLAPALRSRVRTADAKTPDSVTLTLKNGATVKWGSSEDSERKAEVLAVLLSKIKAKTYDVTAPGTPVTK